MLFREEQWMRHSIFFRITGIILIGTLVFLLFGLVNQLLFDNPFGDNPVSDLELLLTNLIVMAFLSAIIWLLYSARLITEINEDGIYVKFMPFIRDWQTFLWEHCEEVYIRQYNPILDYGGYGWRFGLRSKGKAYNVAGNMGLHLIMKDGKELLIGTQKSDELEKVLKDIIEKEKSS